MKDALEPEEGRDLPRGWESIPEWTGGIPPESVDSLRGVRPLEAVYPLLHALVGRNLRDFLVRSAALEDLVADGRPSFTTTDLAEVLYWLDEAARESTLRALRSSGWLEFQPEIGTTITTAGRWAYDVLGFLHKNLKETELHPTIAGVEYALQIGVDPLHHLQSLRSRLQALRQEMETARSSHSEVVLRKAAAKLDEGLKLSGTIRAVLDRIPLERAGARRIVREIHDLLSRLHGVSADLHSSITEIGRQYLHLTAGMTVEQIVRALMRRSQGELAAVTREALLPVFVSPPFINTDVLASAAEQHALKERREPEEVEWTEAPEAPRLPEAADLPKEALALLADLAEVARNRSSPRLDEVIPKGSSAESFLRASLLPLVGDHRAGEGLAGQLGVLPLDVETRGDGWPEAVKSSPIASLTPGQIRSRKEGGNS